jgi:selenocysteine-specific elongation factor
MKSVVVGTAGHIDHGKTALVKALTGVDADRLQEEKRRGITIDLGFAHMDLPTPDGETLHLGFVDVPGHERFIRNMLAGVGGIDLVLLVIAADESIKPQTREHFDILQLLGVSRGITVLSKSDAVDPDTLDVVRLEVEEFLRGTFLESSKAPIVAVSALTGAGLNELKGAIATAAIQGQARDSNALARLPIDRVFTMKGFGTVVTGTLISGRIRKEEELQVFPAGNRARVRAVQVHGQPSDAALAGQRTALNVVGARKEDLARGMTLAPPHTLAATSRADAKLRLLRSAPRALRQRARVHFHSYTMETVAELRFYTTSELKDAEAKSVEAPRYKTQIEPGEEMFVHLKLQDPTLLLPGDRFIIRQFSPLVTIGGGTIVANRAPQKVTDAGQHLEYLKRLASPSREVSLGSLVAGLGPKGITIEEAVARTGWTTVEIAATVSRIPEIARVGDILVARSSLKGVVPNLLFAALDSFHKKNPLVPGMNKDELRGQLPGVAPEVFANVLNDAARGKRVEIIGDLVRLPGRGIALKDEEAESKKKIEEAFASAALKVPALQEVLAGLKIDKVRAQKIVTLLLRDKVLTKVSDELVFHRTALDDLRKRVAAHKAKSATIDVATFKELIGVSRKYAIPLLEYLDRERVTKRVGDSRQIL